MNSLDFLHAKALLVLFEVVHGIFPLHTYPLAPYSEQRMLFTYTTAVRQMITARRGGDPDT